MRVPLNLLRRRRSDKAPTDDEARSPPVSGAESSPEPARRRKFGLRYTLRALLVFITLFMLWGGFHTNRSWKERAAEEILRDRGASFQYGPSPAGPDMRNRLVSAYSKVVQVVWQERFITQVEVHGSLEPEVVDAIVALPHLESLVANPAPRMTDEEVALLRGRHIVEAKVAIPAGAVERVLANHRLKSLWMAAWILSDEDCKAIAAHDSLETVNLYGSRFSEEGLAQIVTLPRLRAVMWSYCQVTGEKLASVPGSNSLDLIECYYAPVGNEFAAFIGRSPNVTRVRCYHQSIDDDFIASIGAHQSLEELNLGHTKVTDSSVTVLEQMPSLKGLTVASESFTDAAKTCLLKGNPTLKVQ